MKKILLMRRDGTTTTFNALKVEEAIRACWRKFETCKQEQQNQPKKICLYLKQKQILILRKIAKLVQLKFSILLVSTIQSIIIPKLQTLTTINYIHTTTRP